MACFRMIVRVESLGAGSSWALRSSIQASLQLLGECNIGALRIRNAHYTIVIIRNTPQKNSVGSYQGCIEVSGLDMFHHSITCLESYDSETNVSASFPVRCWSQLLTLLTFNWALVPEASNPRRQSSDSKTRNPIKP